MASRLRFTANGADLRKILQTDGLRVSRSVGQQIMAIVGTQHYEMTTFVGRNRGRVTVRTKTNFRSMGHEAKHHNLIRALAQIGTGSTRADTTKVRYVSASGRVSMVTQAQADNYNRNRNSG